MESDPRAWIAALRNSHQRLVALVAALTPEQLREQSYCEDWTNAQLLSHIGSGAEIALRMLPGALGQAEHASRDMFQQVRDIWNAKDPDAQAADALAADEQYLGALEQLGGDQLAAIRVPFIGTDLDSVGVIRLRLGEHALHTWDIAVFSDPAATVAPDAVRLLIGTVPQFLAPRLGKPQQQPLRARIRTSEPDRDYLLTAADAVRMTDWPGEDGAGVGQSAGADGIVEIAMPAEALLRLAYGRLDPWHTPAGVSADPADLDRLRAIFPGV